VEQLKAAAYFHRQIVWLQDRFPNAEMQAVPGLCKVVTRAEIAAALMENGRAPETPVAWQAEHCVV